MDSLWHDLKKAGLEAVGLFIAFTALGALAAPYFGWTPSTSGEGPIVLLFVVVYVVVRVYLSRKDPT
jgi:hypothetical protein